MRLTITLVIFLLGVAASVAVWAYTGGTFTFFLLPLIFGLPLVWRRRPPRGG